MKDGSEYVCLDVSFTDGETELEPVCNICLFELVVPTHPRRANTTVIKKKEFLSIIISK